MNDQLLEQFVELIRCQTGISIRPQDKPYLSRKLLNRCRALNYQHPSEYLALLAKPQFTHSQQEWKQLADLITTGESYFFRDQGQIKLLRERLLPDLIARHQQDRTLRLVSAGCSTGEEVYSLAILLKELLPNPTDWQLSIVGYDLSQAAISKAQAGIYGHWSFRGIDPSLQARYFRETGRGWKVVPSLRQWVHFRCLNLLNVAEYDLPPGSVDLIVCRNVLIYLDSAAIQQILGAFVSLLRADGYLLTGHTELQGQDLGPLQVLSFPESVVYQLSRHPLSHPNTPSMPPPIPVLSLEEQTRIALRERNYNHALILAQQWQQSQPNNEECLLLMAQIHADQGRYTKAIALGQQLLSLNPQNIPALFLLAHIAQEQQDKTAAKEYLRRILFLSPNTVEAYVELIELHLSEQELDPVAPLLATVETLLQKQPEDQIVPFRQGVTVALLRHYLRQITAISIPQA
ncbi:MAG: methyltransferase domain-containing protein [Cyanobacteria bacterium J003]|nr:MAG: methyltransferase domain-containing protein [Cyanobacteria bacterium J003]